VKPGWGRPEKGGGEGQGNKRDTGGSTGEEEYSAYYGGFDKGETPSLSRIILGGAKDQKRRKGKSVLTFAVIGAGITVFWGAGEEREE